MASQQKVKKGLPKRTGKEQMKRMVSASHARCLERKSERQAVQRQREKANETLLKGLTWSTQTQRKRLLESLRSESAKTGVTPS